MRREGSGRHQAAVTLLAIAVAIAASLALTALIVSPPLVPTDWARLDAWGIYVPHTITYPWPSVWLQFGLGILMGMALLWGASHRSASLPGLFRSGKMHHAPTAFSPGWGFTPRRPRTLLLLLMLLAFGLRLHALDAFPLIIDEIGFAAHASDILHGQHVPLLAPGHNANPAIFSWMLALAMGALGQNLFAMRVASVLFAPLTVAAVYLLGREWASPRVALLGAAFLATYPAHVHFSRLALHTSVDPFLGALALYLLARGLRTGSARDCAGAGMLAALAQYFYHGARLLPLLLALYALLFLYRNRARWREHLPRLSWLALSFGLFLLPLLASLVVHQLPLTGNRRAFELPPDFPQSMVRAALAWVGQPDVSPFWMDSGPLLLVTALLAVGAGLVICAPRWRESKCMTLLAAVVLTTVFNGFIYATPLYIRYASIAPMIALLVGLGLASLARWRRLFVLAAGLVYLHGFWFALGHPAQVASRISESHWWEDDLAHRAASLPEGLAAVFVVPPRFDDVRMVTIASSVVAYGQRRPVAVNRQRNIPVDEQARRLSSGYVVFRIEDNP